MKKLFLLLCGFACTQVLFAQTRITLADTTVIIPAKQVSSIGRISNDNTMKPNGRSVFFLQTGKAAFEIWAADFDNNNACTDLRRYNIPLKNLDAGSPLICQPMQDKTFAGSEQYVPVLSPAAGLNEFIAAVSYSIYQPHAQPYKESFCNVYFSTEAACAEFCATVNKLLKPKQ